MSDIVNKALEIAEEYPVFPCDEKKRPIVEGGFKSATQDPDKIVAMFSRPNAKLIGMPTGEATGVSVIDIDVRDGKQGKEWVEKNADLLGITRMARTQSGGWHYYYRHTGGIRNRAGISGCVDVRGDGGYVIHPDSEGYSWLNDEDLGNFPSEVAQIAISVTGENLGEEVVTNSFGKITDGREKQMARIIMAIVADFMRQNGAPPTVKYVVDEGWEQYYNSIDLRGGNLEEQGRGLNEFKKKALSTIERARSGKIIDIDKVPPNKQESPSQAKYDAPAPIERNIRIKTLSELRATPPPTFMVADYLIDNSFAVLYGAPASYKSFLALDWALSIAHGVDWNDRPTTQGAVLYLAMEGQSGIAVRAEAWHNENNLSDAGAPFYTVTTPIGMAMQDAPDVIHLTQAIDDTLGGVKPTLIVVDTLARSFAGSGADENSATDMGHFVRSCDLLREIYDCTVLAVHHTGKDSDKGMRGSSALLGAVDTSIAITRSPDTMKVRVSVNKQKDVSEAEPLWLEAREVAFTQSAFAQEQSSLVLEPSSEPRKQNLGEMQKRVLEAVRNLKGSEFEETKGEDTGIPVDIFLAEVAKIKGKPLQSGEKTRITQGLTQGENAIINIYNGLVSERW